VSPVRCSRPMNAGRRPSCNVAFAFAVLASCRVGNGRGVESSAQWFGLQRFGPSPAGAEWGSRGVNLEIDVGNEDCNLASLSCQEFSVAEGDCLWEWLVCEQSLGCGVLRAGSRTRSLESSAWVHLNPVILCSLLFVRVLRFRESFGGACEISS